MHPISDFEMKNAKDIASHLAYSEKLKGLTSGHLQETAQLLEDIEQLQDDVHVLLDDNDTLRAENSQKDATIAEQADRIAELEAHVARLEARPQYEVEVDTYVETQNVDKQLLNYRPKPTTRSKRKSIDLTNQTTLWPNIALSL